MFSWLEGLVSSIASSIGGVFEGIGDTIVNAIWDNLVKWLFNAFYEAIADVFTQMGDMGAEIFDLSWIEAAVHLFFLFGWVLFGVGVIVAAFDLAVEYQNGRATIKSTMLNILKGFFAANLVTVRPCRRLRWRAKLQPGGSSVESFSRQIWPAHRGASTGAAEFADPGGFGLLCAESVLRQYQAGRDFAHPDGGGVALFV